MSKSNPLSRTFLHSPILWGGGVCVGFYWLVSIGVLRGGIVERYFIAHPVEYAAAAMFFVGLAALAIKLVDTTRQRQRLAEPLLGPVPEGGQPVVDCQLLAAKLDRLPANRQGDHLVARLRGVLEHVRRRGSAEGLLDELRERADADAGRLYGSYALVRLVIWAIPVLGFLGTVIGIAMAIGKLSPDALETSLPAVMNSLAVAFNTTTQALGLSIVLMFAQYLTDRRESDLLADVDARAEAELVGRFRDEGHKDDGQLVAVRQMLEAVVGGTERLVERQAGLWRATIEAAASRWTGMAESAERQLESSGKHLELALVASLDQSLRHHAATLVAGEREAADANRQNWERLQQTLVHNSHALTELHETIRQEADLIGRAVDAVGQVTSLEESLNNNLRALAGSRNFEETVMSLAAAIHLLNNRLGQSAAEMPRVELGPQRKTSHAA